MNNPIGSIRYILEEEEQQNYKTISAMERVVEMGSTRSQTRKHKTNKSK
jgi:hypothetical protein